MRLFTVSFWDGFFIAGLNAGAFIMRKEVLKDVKNAFYVGVCY